MCGNCCYFDRLEDFADDGLCIYFKLIPIKKPVVYSNDILAFENEGKNCECFVPQKPDKPGIHYIE